ncbi:hypothetical protein [Sulfuricurvum sp.]|uniref:hypothetical protein n=1 Tax=Sulfuricurvum sp. TaxID=2025608 RepID=UPI003BB5E155
MSEQEERELVKVKIIEDIDFLKSKEIDIRASLRSYFADIQTFSPVDVAFNTVKMNSYDYLDTGSIDDLRKYYTNFLNRFTIASRAFLNNSSNKNTQNELLESAKVFNDYMTTISTVKQTPSPSETAGLAKLLSQDHDKSLSALIHSSSTAAQLVEESVKNMQLNDLEKRIKTLEQEQKPLNEIVIRNEQNEKAYSNEINEIKESIADLQSTEAQDNIHKILTKTLSLYDEAKNSSGLVNQEIQELKNAKEGHIAYNLSKELQHKSDDLKQEYQKKVGSLSWKPWEFSGFYGAIAILLLVNLISWIIYFTANLEIEFWHFMMLKLTINIPLIIYVAFALNEYTKAKKLYEEFDYKRILAQTLMNNYNQFKTDFTDDQDKLLDLIKTPLEKIFDNPVHSIYGDKSGDKNIALDQLEKITSIIKKMDSK